MKPAKILLIASLVLVLVRLLFLQQYLQANPFHGHPIIDSKFYLDWADAIRQHRAFFTQEYHHPPGYPFFLALVFQLTGGSMYAVLLLQSLMLALDALLIYFSVLRLADRRAAWISFALFSLCGPVVFYSMKILSETLCATLILGGFFLLVCWMQRRKPVQLLFAGIFLGAAMEVRGNAFLCLVPAAAAAVWGTGAWKTRAGRLGVLLLGAFVSVAPVLARNVAVAGVFSPVASNWGENFYFANNPDANGSFTRVTGVGTDVESQIRTVQSEASRLAGRPLTSSQAQRFWFKRGLGFVFGHPLEWLKLEVLKLQRLLAWKETSTIYFYTLETRYFQPGLRIFFIGYGILIPLFFVSVAFAPNMRAIALPLAFAAAQVLLMFVFWPELRFLVPAIPFLLMTAGIGLSAMMTRNARVSRNRAAAVALAMIAWLVANLIPFGTTGGHEFWYANAASALYAQGENDRALDMAWRSVRVNPAYANGWVTLGACLYAKGRSDEARQAWLHGLQLSPRNLVALRNLALSYEKDDRNAALMWWKRALETARAANADPEVVHAFEAKVADLEK